MIDEDLELLKKELKVNDERLKKLEEHKKSITPELKNPTSEDDRLRILETMRRLEKNLNMEYKKKEGIIHAIKSKENIET